jgi:hypothetical protein
MVKVPNGRAYGTTQHNVLRDVSCRSSASSKLLRLLLQALSAAQIFTNPAACSSLLFGW